MALGSTQAPLCWVVDDNLVDVELIQIAMESIYPQMEIETFNDGQEVLDTLQGGEKPKPDLMLLDFKMAQVDGLTLLHHLPDSFMENTPVIIFSNSQLEEDQQKALDLGVKEVYEKPYAFWDTKEMLHGILQTYLSFQTVQG